MILNNELWKKGDINDCFEREGYRKRERLRERMKEKERERERGRE